MLNSSSLFMKFGKDFFKTAEQNILMYLHKNSKQILVEKEIIISNISKNLDIAYAHTHRVVSRLEDLRLVYLKRVGRVSIVVLTPNGSKFAQALFYCNELLIQIKKENYDLDSSKILQKREELK